MTSYTKYSSDVLIIGAGGAGLRAAIAAREAGLTVTIVCKSLFGKAHTVMAEGGIAAAMGNVNPNDNWQVHFRDTLRGGKFLNVPRMAELHAQDSPMRVWELETYGALFDRTPDGKISQRNFGGHEYPRLAHVGDRTGLEMIRTLQQKIVSMQQDDARKLGNPEAAMKVFAETTITSLLVGDRRIAGAFGYARATGELMAFAAPAVIIASGGIGKTFKVTSNSWECTGDGMALALRAGARLMNMEFIQFHPTGMVWPPSVKGILVTESVRGDGGVLKNSEGRRFMFDYIPEVFRAQYATTEDEADRWYTDPDHNHRPPELLPRDEVARAINSEVKAGRGSPHGGVFLDIASRRSADYIKKKLPSMHHQFAELADVDITKEPMEVGPTCHYVMGGIEVDADSQMTSLPGLFAAGEAAGGMHGSNRLGGNSLSDLLVFGKLAGDGAVSFVRRVSGRVPEISEEELQLHADQALAPFARGGDPDAENPYTLHADLQDSMNTLVGIIRREGEVAQALQHLDELDRRAQKLAVDGPLIFNPGWHLTFDLRNILLLSRCIALAALTRTESRGGHTREDFPAMDPEWRRRLLYLSLDDNGTVVLTQEYPPPIRRDLLALFERSELKKYITDAEIAVLDGPDGAAVSPAPAASTATASVTSVSATGAEGA
jgi:succinate dehydrogenase / fumarate reductase flavoprotein subunit